MPAGKCKADVYFLADNTGSMGDIVDTVKSDGQAMLEALAALPGVNLTFGVGNYQDFPIEAVSIAYGNAFHRPNALTVGPAGIDRVLFATGPVFQGGSAWPGAATATYAAPIDRIVIPATGNYAIQTRGLIEFTGSSASTVQIRVMSNLQGLISGDSDNLTASPVDVTAGTSFHHFTAGEELYVEVQNNAAFPIDVRWDSEFRAREAPGGHTFNNPYCFLHQLDPTTDLEDVASAFANWRADSGADYPEGWLYALDQLAEAGFWRAGAIRFIVDIGDAPSHDPICAAISGLAYDITEESVTDKLVDGGFVFIGVSHSLPGGGLNDTDTAHDYAAACGPGTILGGHADRIAAATGGYVEYFEADTDVVTALVAIITTALGDCHNVRKQLAWVGQNG